MRWAAGETIVLQEVYKARLWAVRPMIVVQDEPGEIVLWHPKGSIRQVPTNPPTRERLETRAERFAASLTLLDWIHIDNEWDVDTQEPFRRTPRGVRTMDLELDVIIWPDRSWY